ncbi:hypothetical protein BHE74_00042750, partial [Ensete ventricosum]
NDNKRQQWRRQAIATAAMVASNSDCSDGGEEKRQQRWCQQCNPGDQTRISGARARAATAAQQRQQQIRQRQRRDAAM